MSRRTARALQACIVALSLSACGGGSGGEDVAPPPVPTPDPGTSGLVPAALAPGAVLHQDALVLRPLRAGAVWNYRGVDDRNGDPSTAIIYETATSQVEVDGVLREQASNLYADGAAVSSVFIEGGNVLLRESADFIDNGADEHLDTIELRSPVRVNDQYVVLDRHFDDVGEDFDGDGRNDELDLAVWRRVIGEETLELSNIRPVRAVRVDTELRLRVRYSSDGSYSAVVRIAEGVWYAPGIGIVRRRLDRPGTDVPAIRHVAVEELVTWDGVSEGVG